MSAELNFADLSPIEVPVSIAGKQYSLREASGDTACKYRNALLACTQLGPEGKPASIRNMADVEPLLVSLCLFDENDRRVPESVIRSWPSRVQKALFAKAKEISELNESETEELAKNVQGGTEVGFD